MLVVQNGLLSLAVSLSPTEVLRPLPASARALNFSLAQTSCTCNATQLLVISCDSIHMLHCGGLLYPTQNVTLLPCASQIETEMLDCAPLASEGAYPAALHPET
jgi:hypothetical protein